MPEGSHTTMDGYLGWLVARLEEFKYPVAVRPSLARFRALDRGIRPMTMSTRHGDPMTLAKQGTTGLTAAAWGAWSVTAWP